MMKLKPLPKLNAEQKGRKRNKSSPQNAFWFKGNSGSREQGFACVAGISPGGPGTS